ncbi:HAD family hydrolase [Candidatus Pseudothioglobus singularis]|nr:HAD family hydrolase [Candidatus Pseudothioglobus singularis]
MYLKEKIIKNPKAVIFDTDNTLYPYVPAHKEATKAVEEKVVNMLGIKKEDFRSAFKDARSEIKKRLGDVASSHSRLLYMQTTIEKLELGTRILLTLDLEQTYWRTFLNSCKLFPSALSFILLLKSRGIVTANITDLTAQIQFRKLVYFGLDELFNYVVTSEEAGKDKPNKQPFELALKKLNVDPQFVWMIGDDPNSDMAGADSIGIQKIQKRHEGVNIIKSGPKSPNLIFDHYDELIALINHSK